MEIIENGNIFDSLKCVKEICDDADCSKSTSSRPSDDGGDKTESVKNDADDGKDEDRKRQKQKKAERELKKLAFDNKKFNLDASDADYSCDQCGETFLYETQLKSHGVFVHPEPNSSSAARQSGDDTQGTTIVRYRCNVCSKLMPDVQSYLYHFEVKGCKDSEKRRLKAFDSCVCILCGFATTRSQLNSHLRDGHADDAPPLEPTNKADGVFTCPMCVSDSGGNVAVASGVDLLLHLSTWHPTAVTLDRGPAFVEVGVRQGVRRKKNRCNNGGGGGEEDVAIRDGSRTCFRCRVIVPESTYATHRRACTAKARANRRRAATSSSATLRFIKTAKVARKKPSFPIQKSSLSTLKAASFQKLRGQKARQSDGGTNGDQSLRETLEQERLTAVENVESTSASLPSSKKAAYEKLAAVWAKTPRPYRKPYNCINCRKEFTEPLGYFIHLVNRFCYGNRGLLQSSFCPLCNEAVKSAPAVLEHIRRQHCGLDGLRVDKSLRIEFSELASEIIGFLHICSTCGRGFYSKTRCNTSSSKPHLGSKVPLQEVLICKLCSLRVKSGAQLTLHLWAMHDFETAMITKALRSGFGAGDKMVKIESISEYSARRTYDAAMVAAYCPTTDVPLMLKCSSCTSRFASMAALLAHNSEFHEGARRDDSVFHMVAKIFFYRQGESDWSDGSLFDDMLNSDFSAPPAAHVSVERITSIVNSAPSAAPVSVESSTRMEKPVPNNNIPSSSNGGLDGVLPVMVNRSMSERPERKRKLGSETGSGGTKKKNKFATPKPAGITATIAPPQLPRLVRIPISLAVTNNPEVITLDDDDASAGQGAKKATGGGVLATTPGIGSYRSSAPPLNVVAPAMTVQASAGPVPVLLRAFSVRPSVAPVPQLAMVASASASSPARYFFANHTGGKLGVVTTAAPKAMVQNQLLRSTPHLKFVNGLPSRSIPMPSVRFPAPNCVPVSQVVLTTVRAGTAPRPQFLIRAVKSPDAVDQMGKEG